MILHFDQAGVRRLLAHAMAATSRRPTYGQQRSRTPAGLWLVADLGVYLMSNGEPLLDHPFRLVYADETDPKQGVDFETMDVIKRQSSGGDDSVEYLNARKVLKAIDTYQPTERFCLNVTPETIGLLSIALSPRRQAAPAFQALVAANRVKDKRKRQPRTPS